MPTGNITFTHESNKGHIPFLDLNVKVSVTSFLLMCIINKLTGIIIFIIRHPEHTKKSVVYSQALKLSQICSEEKDFEKHICEIKS